MWAGAGAAKVPHRTPHIDRNNVGGASCKRPAWPSQDARCAGRTEAAQGRDIALGFEKVVEAESVEPVSEEEDPCHRFQHVGELRGLGRPVSAWHLYGGCQLEVDNHLIIGGRGLEVVVNVGAVVC